MTFQQRCATVLGCVPEQVTATTGQSGNALRSSPTPNWASSTSRSLPNSMVLLNSSIWMLISTRLSLGKVSVMFQLVAGPPTTLCPLLVIQALKPENQSRITPSISRTIALRLDTTVRVVTVTPSVEGRDRAWL